MFVIDVANQQDALPVDENRVRRAVEAVLRGESVRKARISVAVVDDATIADLHRRYLDCDGPTDVLSFVLDRSSEELEGEVIVSAQTASAVAGRFGWSAADELLLYLVHGTLHLTGCEDDTAGRLDQMRGRERHYLAGFGLTPRYDEAPDESCGLGARASDGGRTLGEKEP